MLTVYANAYLTIGAYKSKGTSDGLFHRTSRRYAELEYSSGDLRGTVLAFSLVTREEALPIDYVTLPNEPLSLRGWVLQERVLSRRTLLYTSQQTCFECDKGIRGETGLALDERFMALRDKPEENVEIVIRHNDNAQRPEKRADYQGKVLAMWHDLLWEYGMRKLSKSSDKLPAISGLASIYARLLNDEYVAGLWRSHLLEGLLWRGLNCRRVQGYRAPSWSWASVDGIPAVDMLGNYKRLAEVLEVKVMLTGGNPYGGVTEARLRLKAPMEPLEICEASQTLNVRMRGVEVGPDFDYPSTGPDSQEETARMMKSLTGVDIFALILVVTDRGIGVPSYRSLIVRKVVNGDEYQRLGILDLDLEELGWRVEENSREEFPVITLV
ncbi:hypothetical protein FGRMN_7028 [Fusarium graminum]|nr:hypothetical protein FGRMN_7028 [Fusarium graminum]